MPKRFPPVPDDFAHPILDPSIEPRYHGKAGLPRPTYKGVPIPHSALVERGILDVVSSDPDCWKAHLTYKLCVLCGVALDNERVWVIANAEGEMVKARGAMHDKCVQITAHWCVHLRKKLADSTMCVYSLSRDDLEQASIIDDGWALEYAIPRTALEKASHEHAGG